MEITRVGVLIIGLGLCLPSTLIILANIVEKLSDPDLYQIDFNKLSIVYLVCLLGWFMVFGVKM